MSFEEEIKGIIADKRKGIIGIRSLIQHQHAKTEPPEELIYEVKDFIDKEVCKECDMPDLLTIVDPDYYKKHKDELVVPHYGTLSPVFFWHLDKLPTIAFEGIRGAIYPIDDKNRHIDFIEMDNTAYFNNLSERRKKRLGRYYHEEHPHKDKPEYKAHIKSVDELYVVFANRTLDNLFDIRKVVRIK